MIETSVAELKARLSHFLRLAAEGETVEVHSHRHSVARIVAASGSSEDFVLCPTRPASDLRKLRGVPIGSAADPVQVLLDDRRRR